MKGEIGNDPLKKFSTYFCTSKLSINIDVVERSSVLACPFLVIDICRVLLL